MSGDADMNEYKFLLTGGVDLGEDWGAKPAEWLPDGPWKELNRACLMGGFKGFIDHFKANIDTYRELFEHPDP